MTPKEYQALSKKVYSIDSNFKDGKVTKKGKEFNLNGARWKVIETEDNQRNGFQGMAVAPIKDGKVDTSQVVIAFAGTNSSDWKDLAADGANVVDSFRGLQLSSANKFSKKIKNTYPNSDISTTGHSLGAFLALAQGAENHWQSVTFNGPDPYGVLSPQAAKWVKENPGLLTNFLNQMDLVGYGGDSIAKFKNGQLFWSVLGFKMNTTGSEVVLDYGYQGINPLNYHDIDLWKFDKNGNLLDGKGKTYKILSPAILNSKMNLLTNSFKNNMKELDVLEKKLSSSGGGLSSNEKIYLDSARAFAVVSTAEGQFNLVMNGFVKTYQKGIKEAEKLWDNTLKEAMRMGAHLGHWEVVEALESSGFTHKNIVELPTKKYQEKIIQIVKQRDDFRNIQREIKAKVSELVARDHELAQQLKQ